MKNILIVIPILVWACETRKSSPEVIDFGAVPFELEEVELLDGPFKHATELNMQSLLNYDPDRMLAKFRLAAGLEPKAEHYKGWESETIAGHSLGHHLSGCALMYASTEDERFLERVNYIVDELAVCQKADGDGFIGAFPNGKKIMEEEVAKGNIRSQGFDLNGIWVPYYNEHKTLAGLRDAYHLCGNEKALQVATGLADWLSTIVLGLSEEQVQTMLRCEFGGIHETLADLYADTGEEKYLKLARVFHHQEIIDPLSKEEDILPGKHSNTQIPKLIASARLYEITGREADRHATEFFWKTVVNHHSYVTGGHGNHEYFGEPDKLRNRLSDETTETCNVYNMLKLSRHLFLWEPRANVADFYERALFNHILSSQHPEDGRVIYNLSLEMGGKKEYQDPLWFTCCIGTGMETHSKYGANIYYHAEEALFVSQYIASEVTWKEKGVKLIQKTGYPESQETSFRFETDQPTQFSLKVRYPYWVKKGMEILVNKEPIVFDQEPGSFVTIDREWEAGDEVHLKFPFSLRLETMPDDSNRVAVFYGPLALAGDIGPENMEMSHEPGYVPVWISPSRNPLEWLEPVDREVNTFKTVGIGNPRDVVLKPFYQTNERRYSVYFDLFTQEKWEKYQQEYQEELRRKKELEARTYDFFQPGERQPERNHDFDGDSLTVINFRNRKGRMANRGGWFAFDMKVMPDQAMTIIVEYWGGYTGSKTFDILVDDEMIATENISGKADGRFLHVVYPIPEKLTTGKKKVHVSFRPHTEHRAGPVFGVRMLTQEDNPL